ncbi:MAG: HAD family hydrolase, partial [Gaiellales bacterium]
VAVLCSNSRRAAERAIDRCGLGRRVATCLGRDDLAHRKPEPDGLIELMSRFSVVRSRAVMVGDSADDLLCARRAGVHAIDVRELRRGRLRAA